MTSKAAKLKAKRASRGRPRKENVQRFPSGKIKPFETEKENKSVVIEARQRIHGKHINVESPYAGYVLGRIFLDGKISEEQRRAGDHYAEVIARYHRLVGIPFPSARAQSLFSIKGHEGDADESLQKRARAASNTMMAVEGILLSCEDGPQVKRTVYNVVVMDFDNLRDMPPQQLLWLKRGLNALNAAR